MLGLSAWHKNNRREIKHTLERYIAIVAIIALGVGFFSGLKITKTAMVNNLNTYASEHKMYDYRLISTLGLTAEDVDYFKAQENMVAEGTVTMDFIADMGTDDRFVLKAHTITDNINSLNILHGRLPMHGNECVLDSRAFSEEVIGSKIYISSSNEDDTIEAFAYDGYTVVGIANSVNYLNYDRGSTSLGSGSVLGFIYIPYDGLDIDYYTEILIRLRDERKVYSQEYQDMIEANEASLKKALTIRGELRYQDIVEEARDKVLEGEEEYNKAYREYLVEKARAEEELNSAWEELKDADREIKENEEKLRDAELKLADGERQLNNSIQEYEESYRQYETEKSSALSLLDTHQAELDQGRQMAVAAMEQIKASGVLEQYAQLEATVVSLEAALSQLDSNSEEFMTMKTQLDMARLASEEIEATGVIEQYAELESTLEELDAAQLEINQGREEANHRFAEAEAQLTEAKSQLDAAKEEVERNRQEIQRGWEALEEGKAEYNKGLEEYNEGRSEAEEAFAEAEAELVKAKEELDTAWKEIEDIPKPKVYVLNRNTNIGYAAFDNDSSIVDGIAQVLPIFFFLVAALVCSTTMTRMVEEQRTQIGTLKAIGYSNGAITRKYISYSGSAAIIGCIIGYLLGTKFFPLAIWEAYGMLYGFAPIEYVFDFKLAIISLIVSLVCSAGVTYITCKAELLQMPAQLIRPKAPKAGKRVLLERIPFIWNRITFLHKVSIRNILRYKRRFFMTILGIAGCTSLVVAAMGISDSIRNVANDQFDTIMTYDYSISFSEELTLEEREEFARKYSEELSECIFVSLGEVEAIKGTIIKKVSTVATDDPDITKVIGLQLHGKSVSYPSYGEVAINEKLAKTLGIEVGDTFTIRSNETDNVEAKVGGIFENYMGNYLFMTGETYRNIFDEEADYLNAYGSTDKEDIYSVSAIISQDANVATVTTLNDMRQMISNMMQSMNYIIWLVIACAGALGFVVIYNLNNINITERSREIATIKVLGFYSMETQVYVFRETLILTAIGALVGLGLGKLLHGFIMNQINVDMVSFKVQIFGKSYLISFIVTFVVTILVNLMLRKKIERINMAESLKSIE